MNGLTTSLLREMSIMRSYLIILIGALALPAVCFAQANVELSVDKTATFDSLADSTAFFSRVTDNKSYCCEIWHHGESNIAPRFDSLSVSDGSLDFLLDRAKISPNLGAGNTPEAARKCFVYSSAATVKNAFITLGVAANVSPIVNANVRCTETTLYGGFNTVVTDFNFIEISNTLGDTDQNEDVRLRITATGTSGATVLDRIITIEAGKRIDVDVHSAAPQDFGPVVITHNGPPGSLRATNAQYRIVTESPLDFEPVLSVPFRQGLD